MNITPESYFLFSGGEVHCTWDGDYFNAGEVKCTDYTMNGFMALAQYKELLDRMGIEAFLTYPYLPYARQDRIMASDQPFSLKVFCNFLNSLNFKRVTIYDPHSDVTPALLNNCEIIPQWKLAARCIPYEHLEDENTLIVSPDAGAYKKVSKLMLDDKRIAIGVKNRGTMGKITHTDVFSPVPIEGKSCLIVDDICDGGRTFIELAKTLRAKGATKIYLYVTHGIFSKGFGELDENIDHIYTTDSFPNKAPAKLVTTTKIV